MPILDHPGPQIATRIEFSTKIPSSTFRVRTVVLLAKDVQNMSSGAVPATLGEMLKPTQRSFHLMAECAGSAGFHPTCRCDIGLSDRD